MPCASDEEIRQMANARHTPYTTPAATFTITPEMTMDQTCTICKSAIYKMPVNDISRLRYASSASSSPLRSRGMISGIVCRTTR